MFQGLGLSVSFWRKDQPYQITTDLVAHRDVLLQASTVGQKYHHGQEIPEGNGSSVLLVHIAPIQGDPIQNLLDMNLGSI